MYRADDIGPGQAQQVVVAFQGRLVFGEARSPEIRFLEVMSLDHRAHRAIEHDDAFGQQTLQACDLVRVFERKAFHGLRANSDSTEKFGARFSMAETRQDWTCRPAPLHSFSSCFSLKPRFRWL